MTKQLDEVLRDVIRDSGKTALEIWMATGVSQPTITEFLRGKDMRLKTAQKLASYFGLELRPVKPPKAK